MLPPKNLMILGVLRCILVHSEAYREAHRASNLTILGVLRCILVHSEAYREAYRLHGKRFIIENLSLLAELLGCIYTIGLLSMPIHRRRKQI